MRLALSLCIGLLSSVVIPMISRADMPAPWPDRAALLDPDAYVYYGGVGWTVTVPPGETWYALNLWNVVIGNAQGPIFHRKADIADAIQLPSGTTLAPLPNFPMSLAYIARPALVSFDPRYLDPEALYNARVALLRTIPLKSLSVNAGNLTAQFPESGKALLRHVSVNDAPWIVLARFQGSQPSYIGWPEPIIATLDETGDTPEFSIRITGSVVLPFNFEIFNSIWMAQGSGTELPDCLNAKCGPSGHVLYQVLPSGW